MPTTPTPFDDEFLADLPYDPSVLLFDAILDVDAAAGRVRCRLPTDATHPFTAHQRVHPTRHPRHVAAAVLVHATGMLGFIHGYHVLGLRHRDGWTGYGTHMHEVTFRKLVEVPGAPIVADCVATRLRRGSGRYVVRYHFEFTHEGERCYEGDQSAFFIRARDAARLAAAKP